MFLMMNSPRLDFSSDMLILITYMLLCDTIKCYRKHVNDYIFHCFELANTQIGVMYL